LCVFVVWTLAAGLPVVFVQEGGYQVEVAGAIVANVFRGMEEGMVEVKEGVSQAS
jgi:acetoin utilization deacetylase AcuC-like enzyme